MEPALTPVIFMPSIFTTPVLLGVQVMGAFSVQSLPLQRIRRLNHSPTSMETSPVVSLPEEDLFSFQSWTCSGSVGSGSVGSGSVGWGSVGSGSVGSGSVG